MNPEKDYIEINKSSWNKRLQAHLESDFYNVERFLAGASSLNSIELALLGNVKDLKILHLQCHFGQDSISLARLGAEVVGVDLSDKAIAAAKELVQKTQTHAKFICCDLYALPEHLNESFDLVFTSYGTIGWLPDINKWANVIDRFLKPSGKLVFVEFHPAVWMFDEHFREIKYSYFNAGPIVETESGSYANPEADFQSEYISWNHPISEVVNSLVQNNLQVEALHEYDYSPYNCFKETEEVGPKQFRIRHLHDKIPMVYAIVAKKNR